MIKISQDIKDLILESAKKQNKHLAIIIKGNPKYIKIPQIKPLANKFYNNIKLMLEQLGYIVKFDAGLPHTLPDINANVWIAHSRGIDRLQYAPKNIITIALDTKDSYDSEANKKILDSNKLQKIRDDNGIDPKHYELSDLDIKNILALKRSS